MSGHKGLDKWFKQDWVDIGAKKKGGGFKKCGRKSAKGSKRKYPKCVAQSILREIHKEDFRIWMESYNPNTSEIDVKQISKLTGISYDSLFPWISNLEMWIAQDKIDSSEMITALEYLMNQEN